MNRYTKIRDFHASRRQGIGASDIPVLAGLTLKYGQTPYGLWLVKTDREAPWPGNEQTEWGKRLEGLILRRYIADPERWGEEEADAFYRAYLRRHHSGPFKVFTEFRHPHYRFALSHPDLLIEDEGLLVQAKSHNYFSAKRREDPDFGYDPEDHSQNGMPASVFLQEQWELLTADLKTANVALLANTNQYSEYGPVTADARTQEKLLALAERFWWHVEHDSPPEPVNWEDVQRLYPVPRQTTAMVGGEQELGVREMKRRKEKLDAAGKRIEAKLKDMKNALGLLIGENSVLVGAEGEVLARSWPQTSESVRLKELREKEPELAEKLKPFITSTPWRGLRW